MLVASAAFCRAELFALSAPAPQQLGFANALPRTDPKDTLLSVGRTLLRTTRRVQTATAPFGGGSMQLPLKTAALVGQSRLRLWLQEASVRLPGRRLLEPEPGGIVLHLSKRERAMLRGVKFTHKAIWARPLDGHKRLETGRIFLDIITLGLFEISRSTAGNAYHWSFVVRGKYERSDPDGNFPEYVYLVAQDNRFDNLCKGLPTSSKGGKKSTSYRMSVHMARTATDAAEFVNGRGKYVFVKYPRQASKKKPVLDDVTPDLCWQPCTKVRSFDDLVGLIKICPSTTRPYSWDKNNCQHFASHLFHKAGDKGRKRGVGRRGVACCV